MGEIITQEGQKIGNETFKACQNELEEWRNKLNPEVILDLAMKNSLLRDQNDKTKWVECFKLIANINKYLFEVMYSDPKIKTRSSIVSQAMRMAAQ